MRNLLLTIPFLFCFNAFAQEGKDLAAELFTEITAHGGELQQQDFQQSLNMREKIVAAIDVCLDREGANIEFSDLYLNESTIVFHFRDLDANQMYLFVGNKNLKESKCYKMSFRDVYKNYSWLNDQ